MSGVKTYISAGVLGLLTAMQGLGLVTVEDTQSLVQAVEVAALIFLRMGVKKAEK